MNFFEKVYELLKIIPKGKVVTYGQIAAKLGAPRSSRAVGYALHVNPDPENIPCFRVVNRNGELSGAFAFGGAEVQKMLLEADGITVENGKVNLDIYGYRFD
ncbi:MAG: MGMT family protein [Clostridia bacterium]|nr:MGMT family protein [Clostridia bacterium]